MLRSELLSVLKRVESALSSRDLIPIFACLCFNKDTVTAYDDVVALTCPLESGLSGGVRGRVLLDFLSASRAKELEVETGDGSVTFKAGRSKLKTPMLLAEDFVFKLPKTEGATEIQVDKAFLTGLAQVLVSLGRDPTHPWRMGVTVALDPDVGITLYSSNNKAASQVRLLRHHKYPELVTVLPPRFCELLVEIGREDQPKKLILTSKWAVVRFASGLRLFSRTIATQDLEQFVKLFKGVVDKHSHFEVPEGLDSCLDRALVVLPFSKDPKTRLTMKEGKLFLATDSPAGNVRDRITVKEGKAHPEVVVDVDPNLFKRALPYATHFHIIDGLCVYLRGPGFDHLVSVIVDATEE